MCLLHIGFQEPIYPEDTLAGAAMRAADNARRAAFHAALRKGVRDLTILADLAGDVESARLALQHWDQDHATSTPTTPTCRACGVDVRYHASCRGADTPFIR